MGNKHRSKVKESASQQTVSNHEFECKSIKTCSSINRIIKYLNDYQNIDITKTKEVNYKDNYTHLIEDFHHILLEHLNDSNSLLKNKEEYDSIYNYIMSKIKKCNLEKCNSFGRNNRNRERENIFSSLNKQININHIDKENEYFMETMDTIHCFLIHSFDIGFKIRINEFVDEKEEISDNEKDENNKQMMNMRKLKDIINTKRKVQRVTNSKFVTQINNNNNGNENDSKDEQKEHENNEQFMASYSFGHRYKYWNNEWQNKYNKREIYISPKYDNLYEELIDNKIFTIDKENFESIKIKAKNIMKSNHSKTFVAEKHPLGKEIYNIKQGKPISNEHIMSVCFYTDFDTLSKEFSATFRSMNKNEPIEMDAKRNSEYAIWSRLLCETVNVYGTNISDSNISVYYHGINCLLLFSSFVTAFNSPTSTTPQITVAAIFASINGCILELAKDSPLKYFNCNWLSSYTNEDERLFVMPTIHPYVVRFVSIRSIRNEANYFNYIHALTSFNYVVDDDGWEFDTKNHKISKQDVKVVNKLLKNKQKNEKDNIPLYIKNLFNSFTKHKVEIKIKFIHLNKDFVLFKNKLYLDITNITNLCNIFPNVKQIWFNFNQGVSARPDDVQKGIISTDFFENLLSQLSSLNKSKNNLYICLEHAKWDVNTFESYKTKFAQQNWQMGLKNGILFYALF